MGVPERFKTRLVLQRGVGKGVRRDDQLRLGQPPSGGRCGGGDALLGSRRRGGVGVEGEEECVRRAAGLLKIE